MTVPRPLADQRVGEMYRVRLFAAGEAALIAVAEPLVEQRSVAEAAAVLWEQYGSGQVESLEWFDVVDARRLSEAREPLVVHIHIVMGEAGQPLLSGWRRVSWAEVERRCGGRIIVEPLVRPFLPRRVEEPAPLVPAAAPANARSERVVTTDDAAHQPVPRLRDVLQGLAAKRAGEALA